MARHSMQSLTLLSVVLSKVIMGLDNFWASESNEFVSFDPEVKLTGGMFSRSGQGSFRGKVYSGFFQEELGVSLYKDMDPEKVREVAEKFKQLEWNEEWSEMEYPENRYPTTKQQFEDLKRMFIAHAQTDFRLVASY